MVWNFDGRIMGDTGIVAAMGGVIGARERGERVRVNIWLRRRSVGDNCYSVYNGHWVAF